MANLIYEMIPKIMEEVGAVKKKGVNTFDNYKFRSIEDVYNALQPALARNGVFIIPKIIESHENTIKSQAGKEQIRIKVKVEYQIFAKDGSFITAVFEGEGIDRSDKATNKAVQASFKYMVSQLFCLAFEGIEDADKESPEIGQAMPRPQFSPPPLPKPQGQKKEETKPIVNHAIQPKTEIESYVTDFSWGTFKSGLSFKELGKNDTKKLRDAIAAWKLKKESENGKIPTQCERFLELSKTYLEQNQ